MRILFYSHYYPPEVNAPASRTSEHAKIWLQAGHHVTVVTCSPNHPGGRIYSGYRNRFFHRETVDGIDVVRVWTFLAANEGFLLRILNYLSFFVMAALVTPFIGRADVVVSTSPQFFCGLVGYFAKLVKRAPWILEIRDLWPESIVAVGAMRSGPGVRCLEWLEALAYRKADRIVAVTDSFVGHIGAITGDRTKISVIKNGVNLALFSRQSDAKCAALPPELVGRVVAAYVGTHGMAHGLGTILEAAEKLRDDPKISFLLVGDGAEREHLLARAKEMKLTNVFILGQRPKSEMPAIWGATSVSLILLRRDDTFKKVLPSKMFEAMAMATPIVLGVEGEAKQLLEESGGGIAITPENSDELAAAVRRLADDPALAAEFGARGATFVRENYDRSILAQRFLDLMSGLVNAK